MHDRRFRFGVIVPKVSSATEFTEIARQAEALGYSTLFVPDHFVDHPLAPIPRSRPRRRSPRRCGSARSCSATTTSIRSCSPARPRPIDLLSDGRLELGIGAGWMTVDYEKAGMPLDRPGVRIARLAESIAILKGLFADGPFSFEGEHYRVTDLDGQPKPVQRPHPPFVIGGGGPKVLALAAREAQIVGINANLRSGDGNSRDAASSLTSARTDEKVQWLRDAAGAHFDDLEIQTLVGFVHFTDDRASIAEAMAASFGVAPDDAILAPVTLVGTESQIVELLEARRERWHMSYTVVPHESMAQLAPIVARLAGT